MAGRLAIAVAVAVLACDSETTSPLPFFFPVNTLSAQPGGPAALITGTLELESNGCLVLATESEPPDRYLVGWPRSVLPGIDEGGGPLVLHDSGLVARVGDTITLSGGAYQSDGEQAFARSKLNTDVPCPGQIWLAWDFNAPITP